MNCVCGEPLGDDDEKLGVHSACLARLDYDALASVVVDGVQRLGMLEAGDKGPLRRSVIKRIVSFHTSAKGQYKTSETARKTFVAVVKELDGLVDPDWVSPIEVAMKRFSPSFSLHPAEEIGRFAWRNTAKRGLQVMLKRQKR